jgi:hypothetical protein
VLSIEIPSGGERFREVDNHKSRIRATSAHHRQSTLDTRPNQTRDNFPMERCTNAQLGLMTSSGDKGFVACLKFGSFMSSEYVFPHMITLLMVLLLQGALISTVYVHSRSRVPCNDQSSNGSTRLIVPMMDKQICINAISFLNVRSVTRLSRATC